MHAVSYNAIELSSGIDVIKFDTPYKADFNMKNLVKFVIINSIDINDFLRFTGYARYVHRPDDFVILVYCVEMGDILASSDLYHCNYAFVYTQIQSKHTWDTR